MLTSFYLKGKMAFQLPDVKSVISVTKPKSGFVLREPVKEETGGRKSDLPSTFEELKDNIDRVSSSYAGARSNFYKKSELIQICTNLQIPCTGEKRDLVIRLRSYISD